MANVYDQTNRSLANAPTYQAVLRGEIPESLRALFPDYVLNNPDQWRSVLLREAARLDGVAMPTGQVRDDGRVADPNDDHWYSDPRFWGPVAVGGLTLGLGLAGGGAAGASAAGNSLGGSLAASAGSAAGPFTAAGTGGAAGLGYGAAAGTAADVFNGAGDVVADTVAKNKAADIIKKILAAAGGVGAAGLASGAFGGGGQAPPATSPELEQMLQMAMRRMAAQEPLFDAVNRQAFAGLPDYVKQGGT